MAKPKEEQAKKTTSKRVGPNVKIIKVRLFTWFQEVDSPVAPGQSVLMERINHMGDEVEITNPVYVRRGEDLDAFYSDEDAKAIREGKYRGSDSEQLSRFRAGAAAIAGPSAVEAADDEGFNVSALSTEQLGEYIKENDLTVDQTVALAGNDLTSIEKVLDAENIASDNDPRKGVVDGLDVKMRAATA